MENNSQNPGATVNKTTFSAVFTNAYLSTVKPGTLVNAFRHSGIYPPNYLSIDQRKLQPSKVFEHSTKEPRHVPNAHQLALKSLEDEMDEDTIKKYQIQLDEGYDLHDPLYNAWKKN